MSTIDNGPSNHEDDLGRALRDLVDDASLPGLDAHLDVVRGRTRRRRAAKKVALGATTLCVAGALGVAALSIPQDVRPEPIAPAESPSPTATPSPTPEPPPTFPAAITASALACQQPAPTPTGDDLPARLSIDIPDLAAQTPGSATAPVLMTFDDKVRLRYDDSATGAYVVVQDGVVVSSSLPAAETTGEATPTPGSSAGWEMEVTTVPTCGGASGHLSRLPAGSYEVFALHRFPLTGYSAQRPDGTWGDEATGTLFDGWLVSEPVPLTITPEPRPDPVEVRDALWDDTSMVLEALRRASRTGAPAVVDLTFESDNFQEIQIVTTGDGKRTLTVHKNSDVAPRERTASDDGWRLELEGGAVFTDAGFSRLMGTYAVTENSSGQVPTFALRVLDGGTPKAAPATTDRETCRAFRSTEDTTTSVYEAFSTDIYALAADLRPAVSSPEYQEIRSRWLDAPRFWWAVQAHGKLVRDSDLGGDFVNGACGEYWE
ncbi:hypothetical protein [Oerskovia paurometabola]|uniref:hypothetical protein n=1 Tax=Oerskovia paurometabola TaxID=162170 RepID=UPI0038292CEF